MYLAIYWNKADGLKPSYRPMENTKEETEVLPNETHLVWKMAGKASLDAELPCRHLLSSASNLWEEALDPMHGRDSAQLTSTTDMDLRNTRDEELLEF